MSCEGGEVRFDLTLDATKAVNNLKDLETALFRYYVIAKRLGLPEDITRQIDRIYQLILAARTLRTALLAVQAASGPLGLVTAFAGVIAGGLMLGMPSVTARRTEIERRATEW